jgi:hypothetical protein
MSQVVSAIFDRYTDAADAVALLEADGISHERVSLMAGNADGLHDHRVAATLDPKTGEQGAALGGVVGAGTGLLAGLGILTVPGLGPVVAAGWLASALASTLAGGMTGGAIGGILGLLADHGVSQQDAQRYSEEIRRGGVLVSVRVETNQERDLAEGLIHKARGVAVDSEHPNTRHEADGAEIDPRAYSDNEQAAERSRLSKPI